VVNVLSLWSPDYFNTTNRQLAKHTGLTQNPQ